MVKRLVCLIFSAAILFGTSAKSFSMDTSDLTGKWKGTLSMSRGGEWIIQTAEMEISDGKGKITFIGSPRSFTYPLVFGDPPSEDDQSNATGYCKLENCKLTIFWEKERWAVLTLSESRGKIKLEGEIQWRRDKGTLNLTLKKK